MARVSAQGAEELEAAAKHWDGVADAQDELATVASLSGHAINAHKCRAESYRRTATALRLQSKTGRAHCSCCLSADKWHGNMK